MEATSSKINNMFNPNVIMLDHYDATNFTHWKDTFLFLLTKLGITYILSPNLQPISSPSNKDSVGLKDQGMKHEEDEARCGGFILNSLSDKL